MTTRAKHLLRFSRKGRRKEKKRKKGKKKEKERERSKSKFAMLLSLRILRYSSSASELNNMY